MTDGPEMKSEAEDDTPPIQVEGLVSQFGEHLIHDGLDLSVRPGEVLGLVGGSGAGKSVLLNTLIGLKRPEGGRVKIFGHDLATATKQDWDEIEQSWGILFQQGALFSNLTVLENVSAPLIEHTSLPHAAIADIATLKIAMVGLQPEAAFLKPAELSGGMIKRVSLARALALDPKLLFLDEPTSGLDPISAAAFDELIAGLSASLKLTVFMITHDLDSILNWAEMHEMSYIFCCRANRHYTCCPYTPR